MEFVTVDKDILDFLRYVCIGSLDNAYKASSKRAYLDLNRTIRFESIDEKKRNEIREEVDNLIEEEIKEIIKVKVCSQDQYDKWHFNVCNKIKNKYIDQNVNFYIGQSQKWLNMTIKYLYIIGECDFSSIFEFLHVPLDNYVFDAVKKELGIVKPKKPWSRMDEYDEYICYQRQIKNAVDIDPLRWEFKSWIDEARKRTQVNI